MHQQCGAKLGPIFDCVVEMISRMTNQAFNAGKETNESRVNSQGNPTVYLAALIDYLEFPEQLRIFSDCNGLWGKAILVT